MAKEIERKWLIDKLPKINRNDGIKISQGYIVSDGVSEVRVRKYGKKHTLTVKRGIGVVRDEIEIPLTVPIFNAVWELTNDKRIEKIRHVFKQDGNQIEIDIYGGELMGLHVAEVEFDSVEEAMKFEPLQWMGRELTGDKRYSNKVLAEKGLPDEKK